MELKTVIVIDNSSYPLGGTAQVAFISALELKKRGYEVVYDYYVAGRRAPTILIVGSLVASFLSTGAFLGDTGEVYSGFFMPIVIVGVMQGTGYLFGATLFGRYVRRSGASRACKRAARRSRTSLSRTIISSRLTG